MVNKDVLTHHQPFEIRLAQTLIVSRLKEWETQGNNADKKRDLVREGLTNFQASLEGRARGGNTVGLLLTVAKQDWIDANSLETDIQSFPEQVDSQVFEQALESELRKASRDPGAFMEFHRVSNTP